MSAANKAPLPPLTPKQRLLRALRGEPVDRVPWAPRLDLWLNAQRYQGTLPPHWRDASLLDIVRELDWPYHGVIPNFLDVEHPDEIADRAINVDHVPHQPYRVRFRRVRRRVERRGDDIRVVYQLPSGEELSALLRYDEAMRRAGVTLLHVQEHVIKSREDYARLGALFADIVVEPDNTRFAALQKEIGEAGLVVALAHLAASPVHHLLKDVAPYDRLYYDLHDHPDVISDLAQAMTPYWHAVLAACAQSEAEIVLYGANYDLMITPPPLFEKHIAPWLKQAADVLHAAGKMLLTHTDGENDQLCRFYVECGVDVADSVCPAPMTRLPLAEYRRQFGTRPAIWGGLCSICVLPDAMSEAQFEAHVEEALAAIGDGRGIVFSLADTTPPQASWERLQRLAEKIAAFRPA